MPFGMLRLGLNCYTGEICNAKTSLSTIKKFVVNLSHNAFAGAKTEAAVIHLELNNLV